VVTTNIATFRDSTSCSCTTYNTTYILRHILDDRDHFYYCAHLLFEVDAALGLTLKQERFESVRTQDAENDRRNQEA
jgi:cephalosporin-C deacetylase-like acetyl esterase